MPESTISSLEDCLAHHAEFVPEIDGVYCNATYDTFLCWAPTLAGTAATQKCPPVKMSDTSKLVTKRCSVYGFWEGKETNNNIGWTNYTVCYPLELQELLVKLGVGMGDSYKMKMEIAERTRQLEFFGLSISLVALLISLGIFCYFRGLRNNRTRIHKNLFVAMMVQVMIRLTVYIDQALLSQNSAKQSVEIKGLDNTPYLCQASYVLLEYARTVMFMWMFIEGMYLHNMVTVTVFQERQCHGLYHIMGWGFPVLLTSAWAVTTALYFGHTVCWWGYSLFGFYWILEGPRLAVILLNFVFLLNIIRVLVMKLRQSHTSEIDQVRKAVRAAVVLLPLLGITNLLNMARAPVDKAPWEFALWSYTTHFLTSFQGFFIALIYCFLNGEVRTAIAKHISLLTDLREQRTQFRRSSGFHYASSDGTRRDNVNPREEKKHWWACCTQSCRKKPVEIPVCETSAPESTL